MSLDLVVVGNLLLDDVVLPDGRTRMAEPGGAVLYMALAARLWGLSVGAVSVLGEDYPASALDTLAGRGIALDGLHRSRGPGLRTWLLYEGARRRVVLRLEGPTHAEVSPGPERVPPSWLSARAFHLAPMPMEVQTELVRALSGGERLLSIDPYVLVRPDTLEAWRGLLARVDALFLSEDEMEITGETGDPVTGHLAGGRLAHVVYKRGARGGALYDLRTGRRTDWKPRAAAVVDPTGAGDAFAAGVLAGWLRGEAHEQALQRGIVGASFAIEDWGPAGILRATPEAADARLREWFGT